jgi:hypothetical protein
MTVTTFLFQLIIILVAFYIFGKLHSTQATNLSLSHPKPRTLGTEVHTNLLKSCFFRHDRSADTTLPGY